MSGPEMNDGSRAEAALIGRLHAAGTRGPASPPDGLDVDDMARTAVRRTKRRRTTIGATVGVAAFALLGIGVSQAGTLTAEPETLPGGSPTQIEVAESSPEPAPTPSFTVTPEPASVPQGYQPAEFQGLSYAVPEGWENVRPIGEPGESDWYSDEAREETNSEEPDDPSILRDSIWNQVMADPPQGEYSQDGWTVLRDDEFRLNDEGDVRVLIHRQEPSGFTEAYVGVQQDGGLYYSFHFNWNDGSRLDLIEVTDALVDSLAFTKAAEEARAEFPPLQPPFTGDLPVYEADRDIPADWHGEETDGMSYALPQEFEVSDLGWVGTGDMLGAVDAQFTIIYREGQGYTGSERSARALEVEGAGRADLEFVVGTFDSREGTFGAYRLTVYDEDLQNSWFVRATLPDTPEGEAMAAKILGSIRVS